MKSFIEISLISVLFQFGYAAIVQDGDTTIEGSYIVTLESSTEPKVLDDHLARVQHEIDSAQHSRGKNKINYEYRKVLTGYSAEFTDDVLAKVKAMPEVVAVEKDQIGEEDEIQKKAPWGLARLSSKGVLEKSKSYSYHHDPDAGEGVDVYVIDTGIEIDHPGFEGRAKWGANFVDDIDTDVRAMVRMWQVLLVHLNYGVAKKSTMYAVKVINAQGKTNASQLIAGVEWAVNNKKEGRGCVINLSTGVLYSEDLNTAVSNAVQEWECVVTAAAGNKNVDACLYSPGSEPKAITVGYSDIDDWRVELSNWGKCLTVFAPGKKILSTVIEGGAGEKSGTSMAAPHVAGLAANVMSKYKKYQPDFVTKYIKKHSNKGVLADVGKESPKLLASNIGLF
ncbi:proteinase B [Entomophthora muscae]|uniref:Proteinase B n=1 Tax=Entomophthora muscae TaxID=34485 RepID=A0ACC2RLQ1_9FUNG|nr:proteinase B [Entomophthora muscae]